MNADNQPELIPVTPGELLRHAREKRRESIDGVAAQIRIRPEILHSIECGQTEHIAAVYLKGYIRAYARYLGLAAESIERSIGQARGAEPEVQSIFKAGLPRNPGERWFKATSYFVASAVVIALGWQFTNEAVRFSQSGSLLRSATPPVAVEGDNGTTDSLSPERGAPGNTHLKASIAPIELDQGHATPAPGGGRVAEGAWAALSARNQVAPAGQPGIGEAGLLRISTSADSWVEITDGNGEQLEMDLLRAGSAREYSGTAPFRLLIGRASSVELLFGGQKFDLAPHTRGNVARVTLGAEAAAPAAADEQPVGESSPDAVPDQG